MMGNRPTSSRLSVSPLATRWSGGIRHIPQADLLVSAEEWSILSEPHPEQDWILREHIEIPSAKWQQITFVPTDDPLFEGFEVSDVSTNGTV